ncbi:MAG: site-specific integrase [Rubrivivax sp.]|nr:site-specific integrase [Rubrivivax sp.]
MPADQEPERGNENAAQAVEMLKAVVDGATYDAVASRFGVTRTAVERRIKAIAARLSKEVGIEGLNADGVAFVQRLRQHRAAILVALAGFEPPAPFGPRHHRVVASDEITQAAQRIKGRSARPWHDQSMFYMLFATGARPLEIARIEVRDYLGTDGSVRRASELRAEAAITGKPRPLYFTSTRLDDALAAYLSERVEQGQGVTTGSGYRGLDPHSCLFLSPAGLGFAIKAFGADGQRRYLCRPILEAYRKLFRYADLRDVTPLSARHTVAARLYERGADEEQVGVLLGISGRSAVRDLFPKRRPAMSELVHDLV